MKKCYNILLLASLILIGCGRDESAYIINKTGKPIIIKLGLHNITHDPTKYLVADALDGVTSSDYINGSSSDGKPDVDMRLNKKVGAEDYFDRMYIPYVPIWSFGERLPILESRRELHDPKTIGSAYLALSRLLRDQLDWYAVTGSSDSQSVQSATIALQQKEVALQQKEVEYATLVAKTEKRSLSRRRFINTGAISASALAIGGGLAYFRNKTAPKFSIRWSHVEDVPILTVAYSPGGTKIVSGGTDGTLKLWDAETGSSAKSSVKGHEVTIQSVAVSGDGTQIVSGGRDGAVRLWDAQTLSEIGVPMTGHKGNVQSVAFLGDGTRIVSGGVDGTVRLWDAEKQVEISSGETGNQSWVQSVAFSGDGTRIVSAGNASTVRLWDAQTLALIGAPMRGHEGIVLSVAFSGNGTRIVSGDVDGTLRLWDAQTQAAIGAPMTGHLGYIDSVAFSGDGTRIVSGSRDGSVKIWSTESQELIFSITSDEIGSQGGTTVAQFSPNGRAIVVGTGDGQIAVLDLN